VSGKMVLFLHGSPRGKRSASLYTAKYLARFLDFDDQFVDVARARLSTDAAQADPNFLNIVRKMQAADVLVWTFGVYIMYVPVQMQYLIDKLLTQDYTFDGKLSAAVATSARVHDDAALDRVRFISEQLGMAYLGDVSATGNPFFGYVEDEEVTESSCRILAGQINRALADGYLPARRYSPVERQYLLPTHRGHGFAVEGPEAPKTGCKTILVLTGNRLAEDPANASIVAAIRRFSHNQVEVIELQDHKVGPCLGCYSCDLHLDGACVVKDEYEAIKRRLHEVDGIVYVATCASGLVDAHMKAFLDRSWGMAHRPSLRGKYGFVTVTGGGPLEPGAAAYLRDVLGKTGTCCVAALSQSATDDAGLLASLRRAVEDLDRALDEKWQIADRFSVRASALTFRDLVAKNGMELRADYQFYSENGLFDYPSRGGANALLRRLMRNKRLEKTLLASTLRQREKDRQKRLAQYLVQHGSMGRGLEISK
jgi:multimeric flavodoxin WrbA